MLWQGLKFWYDYFGLRLGQPRPIINNVRMEGQESLYRPKRITSILFLFLLFSYLGFLSTDRSKAVVPVLVLLLVALWFILRGDLLYVFPCVILFLCFSVLLVLRLPRLGKRELILLLLVRLFGLCLFRFVGFLFLLGSGKGCGL